MASQVDSDLRKQKKEASLRDASHKMLYFFELSATTKEQAAKTKQNHRHRLGNHIKYLGIH